MPPSIPELGHFAEPALLILISLGDGPKHGYAIMVDIEDATEAAHGTGDPLPAPRRALEERGLIEALPPEDRRRPYKLTAQGSSVLAEQLLDMADLAALGLRRLRSRPG